MSCATPDTAGFANDYDRVNARRYRDYVVRAFNARQALCPQRRTEAVEKYLRRRRVAARGADLSARAGSFARL